MADVRRHVFDNGICVTCGPHVLDDGECVTCRSNPPDLYLLRDPYTGGWIEGGAKAVAELFASRKDWNPALHPRAPGGEGGGRFVSSPGGAGSFADKIAGALTEADALTAAPVHMVVDHDKGKLTLAGVPEPQQRDLLLGVLAYSGGTHDDINAVLRGGAVRGSRSSAEADIKKVDMAMSHSPLSHDVVTYRGIQDGRAVFGDAWEGDMTGVRFREPAYSSTTADRRIVDDFIDNRDPAPTEMRIHVPAGTNAINISGYGDDHTDEAELLLDRGTSFRVISDTTGRGRRLLDVEVIP